MPNAVAPVPDVTEADLDRFVQTIGRGRRPLRDALREAITDDRARVAREQQRALADTARQSRGA